METRGVRNILTTFYKAGPIELEAGRDWYPRAWRLASDLGLLYRTDVDKVAGMLAALSPGISWAETVSGAETLLDECINDKAPAPPPVPGYSSNIRKAWNILTNTQGFGPLHYFNPKTGPKTHAFVRNILGETNMVTIDGHAVSIREGARFPVSDPRANLWPAKYRRIAEEYRHAADIVGEYPRDLQAITWVTWQKLHGINGASLQQELFLEDSTPDPF